MRFRIVKHGGEATIWLRRASPAAIWGPRRLAEVHESLAAARRSLSQLSPHERQEARIVPDAAPKQA